MGGVDLGCPSIRLSVVVDDWDPLTLIGINFSLLFLVTSLATLVKSLMLSSHVRNTALASVMIYSSYQISAYSQRAKYSHLLKSLKGLVNQSMARQHFQHNFVEIPADRLNQG